MDNTSPDSAGTWSLSLKDLIGGTSIVAVLGLGISYATLAGFYGAFGLTPEDVGINSPYSLIRLSLGGAIILLVLAIAFAPVITRLYPRMPKVSDSPEGPKFVPKWTAMIRRTRADRWGAWAPMTVIVAGYFCYEAFLWLQFDTSFPLKVLAPLLIGGGTTTLLLRDTRRQEGMAFRVRIFFGALAFFATATLTLNFVANQAGGELRSQGVRSGVTVLVGFTPPVANAVQTTGSSTTTTKVLVLGRSSDGWILFDCGKDEVFRREASEVEVITLPMTYAAFSPMIC